MTTGHRLELYKQLQELVADMIEDGRLRKADCPQDYPKLVAIINDLQTTQAQNKLKTIVEDIATEVLGKAPHTGGCRPFYTPAEWAARDEEYGLDAALIICHDGGDYATLCNLDYGAYKLYDEFTQKFMKRTGGYIEQCTSWYSAVYM